MRKVKVTNIDSNETKLNASAVADAPPAIDTTTNAADYDGDDEMGEVEGDTSNDVAAPTSEDFEQSEFAKQCIAEPNKVWELVPQTIIADPTRNGRVEVRKATDPDVKELADAIKEHGQMQPGEISLMPDGKMFLDFGFGRFAAIELINSTRNIEDQLPFLARVRVVTSDVSEAATSRVRNAVENWKRKELTVMDKAQIVADLMAPPLSLSQADVVRRLGVKSRTSVSMYAKLAALPQTGKDAIHAGKITPKRAYEIAVLPAEKQQKEIDAAIAESAAVGGPATSKTTKKAKRAARGADATEEPTGKEPRKLKALLEVVDTESVPLTDKTYGKGTVARLKAIGAFMSGKITEKVFLKRLGE
jgi:ParB/RepB/Spo0J family partition protein